MSLTAGTRLGSYEILSALGAGGMGEVYRARDTKLNRDVAIKVLLPAVANDPDRLARFSREAQVLASLNHPNIAHIYGVEEANGMTALVMELVEGEDLSQRISRGAIPIDEALPIARQIAEAFEAAHDHGIIHRDLKPANIKIRADGTVKVLDFGLAKAVDPTAASSATAMNSPTLSIHATQAGIILGTAAYMSPEQARGKAVDKRADIWAFGVVLYEMLTGRQLFAGETLSDTIAAVLTRDFDWTALPRDTPAGVRRLLARALERDPRRRLRDIGDARVELDHGQEISEDTAKSLRPLAVGALRGAMIFAAGAAIASALFFAWLGARPASDDAASVQFLITPRDGVPFNDEFALNFVLAPDGSQILVRGRRGGGAFAWYLRSMADGKVRQVESLNTAVGTPFWSPDSRSIGFLTASSLSRVAPDNTGLTVIARLERDAPLATRGGAWSVNGEIAFVIDGAIVAVPDRGGQLRVVLARDASAPEFISTSALPDGKHVLAQRGRGFGDTQVVLVALDGSSAIHLVDGVQPVYVAPGWLLAVTDEARLVAWKFNLAQRRIEGDAHTIQQSIAFARSGIGVRLFSASQTGVLAFRSDDGSDIVRTRLVWVDRAGAESASLKLDRHCRNPELSPAGDRVALECYQSGNASNRDVWIYDLARNAASRLTVDGADDADPLWSADGRTIVFGSNRMGTVDIFKTAAGGVGDDELVLKTPGNTVPSAWSPDGQWIAMLEFGGDVIAFDFAKRSPSQPVVASEFQELELQFSPDGRWFSYSSDESGRPEIYVQPWPANGDRWQVSIDGGTDARWRRDGGELYYLSPTRSLMAAPIVVTPSFRVGAPVRLFDTRIAGPLGNGHRFPYAVAEDGKRFLLYVSDQNAIPPALEVMVNWPARLASGRQP